MSFLTQDFDDVVNYKGKDFHFNMAFDNILLLFEMFDEESFDDFQKIDMAYEMLLIEHEELMFGDVNEFLALFYFIFEEFFGIKLKSNMETKKEAKDSPSDMSGVGSDDEKPQKFVDYAKDADIIYASFMSEYKMDLIEQRGKLHWKKFQALFNNLKDDSKIKQVIGYRTAKIPTGKHVDKETVDHIRKMKRIYSLNGGEGSPQGSSVALNIISNALKHGAKTKQ